MQEKVPFLASRMTERVLKRLYLFNEQWRLSLLLLYITFNCRATVVEAPVGLNFWLTKKRSRDWTELEGKCLDPLTH